MVRKLRNEVGGDEVDEQQITRIIHGVQTATAMPGVLDTIRKMTS
jgi:hypothetical protein